MNCIHCGDDEHGPTMCKQELAIRLAESKADHTDDRLEMASMHLEISDLRRQVRLLQMERRR